MAQAGIIPILTTPADAIAALERDLPKALKGRTFEKAGWRRLDDLSLLVPISGIQPNGTVDEYFLRLGFAYYDDWPPSVQFVNPETCGYDLTTDKCWVPRIEGTGEIQVHADYNSNGHRLQLVCCSLTLEFYLIRHDVKAEHVWNRDKHNFAGTINQIEWAVKSPFYKGRQNALPAG